jgi:uncharacterized protein YacL
MEQSVSTAMNAQQTVSTAMNAQQMLSDFFQIIKLALTTKFGLVITLLCATIYLFTLWFFGISKDYGLIFWILTLIGTIVMSWLTWFNKDVSST